MKKALLFLFGLIGLISIANAQANYYSEIKFKNNVYFDKLNQNIEAQKVLVSDYLGKLGYLDKSEIGKIDSGEVIGNYLYLFQKTDTVIVDVSSLAGGGGTDTSLWKYNNGKLMPKQEVPLVQTFQNAQIKNDSLDLGVVKLPFAGILSPNIGTYKGINGWVNSSSIGGRNQFIIGYADFLGNKRNNIEISDSTYFKIQANNELKADVSTIGKPFKGESFIFPYDDIPKAGIAIDKKQNYSIGCSAFADTSNNNLYSNIFYAVLDSANNITDIARVEASNIHSEMRFIDNYVEVDSLSIDMQATNGLIIPRLTADPVGENGAIYYNTTSNLFRFNRNGVWYNMLAYTDTIYTNDAAADADGTLKSGIGYRLTGDRTLFIKP